MSRPHASNIARPLTVSRAAIDASGWLVGRLRAAAGKPRLVVGAIVALVAAILAIFSLQITGYEPDEVGYTHLALGIAHSLTPITLSHGGGQRLNQLYPLLIAPMWGLFGNVTAFRMVHLWNALLMASSAIPAYLLAFEVVRRRWAAYLAAALVAVVPWMTLSLAELTEVAAFPACLWALLAMQRALLVPSAFRDFVALVAIALATYGRLQLVVLAPVFLIAVLLHELGYALTTRGDRRASIGEAFKKLARQHTVLCVAGGVGLLVGLPLLLSGKLASLAGFYGNTITSVTFDGATFDLARSYFSFVALGLAAVPASLAIGFIFETLLRPISRRAHAFASVAAVAVIALTLQVAEVSERVNAGTLQERYLFYIVPLLAVGMCAALLYTRHPSRMIFSGSLALALLVGTTQYQTERTAFWYQVSPSMTNFYDWIRPMFGAAGGASADPGASRQMLAGAVIFALGLLIAVLARRVSGSRLLAGVGVLAIGLCGAETVHALWRVTHGSSSGKGFGGGSVALADWVDRSVPRGAAVMQVVSNVGGLPQTRGLWEDSEFWNRSIVGAYTFGGAVDSYFPTEVLHLDPLSGVVRDAQGSQLFTHYLIDASRGFAAQLAGTVLAHSRDSSLELLRTRTPLHATWTVMGVSSDGWLSIERPAKVRIYELRGAPGRCVDVGVTLSLSSLSPASRTLLVTALRDRRELTFAPGDIKTVYARVCGKASTAPQLSIANRQGASVPDPQLTLQLLRVTVKSA